VIDHPLRVIRLNDVVKLTGLSKSAIYASVNFPSPVRLSRRAVGWRLSDVTEWLEALPDARTAAGNIH
jgi:prophage regulatory protein